MPLMFGGVGILACHRFVAREPLVCQICACCTAQLTDLLVGQSPWTTQEATDRHVLVVLFTSDDVIDTDRLVQVRGVDLIDESSVLVCSGRIVWIITGVLNDLRDRPHGNQIPSPFIITPQAFARRDDLQPVPQQEIAKDPMVRVPAQVCASGLLGLVSFPLHQHIGHSKG